VQALDGPSGENLKTKIIRAFILMAYPSIFMGPLFTSRQNSHLGRGLTDIDGAIHFAAVLQQMKYPWSINQFTDFIDGASMWRLQNFSQLLPISYMWAATRIISAPLAVSFYILVGWVLTGFVVFLLSKKLNLSNIASLLVAVIVQMLPILRTNAGNYTNYVWICVPLFSIYLLVEVLEKPTRKNWTKVILSTVAIAFFDIYWFYFVLIAGALCIFMLRKDIWLKFRCLGTFLQLSVIIGLTSAGWVTIQTLINVSGPRDEMNLSRPISITELRVIRTQAAKLLDYVHRPWTELFGGDRNVNLPVGYIGLLIALMAIFGILLSVRQKKLRFIALLAFTYSLLTLQPELEVFRITFPLPSGLYRYISPGVQYPTRAGMIGVVLISVMAGVGASEILRKFTITRPLKVMATGLLLVVVVIDLNPFADRVYSNEYDQYATARKELSRDPNAAVLALPLDKFQRTWHEQWILGVPFANSMYKGEVGVKIDKQLSGGPGSFASFLNWSGIHYLYTNDLGSLDLLRFGLHEPRFRKITTVSTYGYEKGRVKMSLYKVTAQPSDVPCVVCRPITQTEILGTYPSDDGGKSYWTSTDLVQIKVTNSGPLKIWFDTLISRPVTFDVYSLNRQKIEISDSGGTKVVTLEPNKGFRYVAQASSVNPVRIKSQLPCAKPMSIFANSKDPRDLCFNIFNVSS
jgi:hypothetical protein